MNNNIVKLKDFNGNYVNPKTTFKAVVSEDNSLTLIDIINRNDINFSNINVSIDDIERELLNTVAKDIGMSGKKLRLMNSKGEFIGNGIEANLEGGGSGGKDGREVELRKTNDSIEWRYKDELEWRVLIPIIELVGPRGATGATGPKGATGDDATLKENITVSGVTVGNLSPGTILEAGTSITEILKRMLVKVSKPVYSSPTVSVTSDIVSAELGSRVTPTITTRFAQNDAGVVNNFILKKSGVTALEGLPIRTFTDTSFILNEPTSYRAEVSYDDGPIKNDSLGEPDPTGRIPAGTKTSTITVTPYRAYWGITTTESNIPTGTQIRGKTKNGINPSNGTTITAVTTPDSRSVIFAYPATLRDCIQIEYKEQEDKDNKSAFTQTTVSIADANGNNPISYRVYYYTAPISFGTTATFILTI